MFIMAFNYLPRAHKNRCIRTNKREGVELVSYYAFLFTLQASVQQLSHKIPMHFNEMYIHHIMYMYLCLYYPSSVFVLNHTSPDDFQPLSLREMHSELAANFQGAKVNITGKCVYLLIIPYGGYLSPGEHFRQFRHLLPLAKILSMNIFSCINDYTVDVVTFTTLAKKKIQ